MFPNREQFEAARGSGVAGLYRAMETWIEPSAYDGGDSCGCLIGQPFLALLLYHEADLEDSPPKMVAEFFDVPNELTRKIFDGVNRKAYRKDYEASLKLAADILDVEVEEG